MKTKTCTKCETEKGLTEFNKDKNRRDKLSPWCRECASRANKARYHKDPEKFRRKGRQWREANLELNHEVMTKSCRKWRETNRDREREMARLRYKLNPEKYDLIRRAWIDRTRDQRNKYYRDRRESDPDFKLRWYLRTGIRRALKKGQKAGSAVRDLGCTIPELWEHLEVRFVPGMTKENYGPVWHIDHIIPLASFDLTDREQFLKAAHYTNLQPLFAEENLKKGAKMPSEL